MIKIPENLEGLELAAEKILAGSPSAGPILEGIRIRKKWRNIKREYKELQKDVTPKEARRILAEKHFYSEKTIQVIIYNR